MSLPNNVQIVLMQGKTVVSDTVILIAASNFHVFLTVIGAVRITKENFFYLLERHSSGGPSMVPGS